MWDMVQIHEKTICGLPVIYCQLPFCGTIYIGYYVAAGSFAEEHQHGLAHCVEHMMLRRTANYTPERLHIAIGLLGANNNGYTSTYRTNYFLEVVPGNMKKALDLMTEVMWRTSFDADDWKKERNIILDEMDSMEDSPFSDFFDRADAKLFNHQAGHSIIGTARQTRSYTVQDLVNFYHSHYGRNTATLVMVGAMPEAQVFDACEATLARVSMPVVKKVKIEAPLLVEGRKIAFRKAGLNQCYMMLTMRAPRTLPNGNPDHVCALTALGGDTWSLLFKQLREKLGLCYAIHAWPHHMNPNEGSSVISAECTRENLSKVLSSVRSCVSDMANGRLSRNLCRAAKAATEMQMHEMLSKPERLGDFLGARATFGMKASLVDSFDALHRVTEDDIRQAAAKWCCQIVSQATMIPV